MRAAAPSGLARFGLIFVLAHKRPTVSAVPRVLDWGMAKKIELPDGFSDLPVSMWQPEFAPNAATMARFDADPYELQCACSQWMHIVRHPPAHMAWPSAPMGSGWRRAVNHPTYRAQGVPVKSQSGMSIPAENF
jgi:hypothetical protein